MMRTDSPYCDYPVNIPTEESPIGEKARLGVERWANAVRGMSRAKAETSLDDARRAKSDEHVAIQAAGTIRKVVGKTMTAYVLPEGEKWPTFLVPSQKTAPSPHIYLHRHDVANAGRNTHTIE
jgi:hypothetical protein